MQTRKFTPYLQALLAAALFGLSTPLAKLLLGEMDSIVLAALLYLGSGMGALICIIALRTRSFGARLRIQKPVAHTWTKQKNEIASSHTCPGGQCQGSLLAMTFGSNKEARPVEASLTRPDLPWLAGAVLTGGVAAPIILMMGLKHTPATTASLLLNFEGVATTLIAALVFKEAVGRRIIAAMLLVTLASVLLSLDGGGLWGFSLGALGVLAACLLWGLDNNFTRHISAKDPLQIVAIKGLGAGAFSLTLAFALGKSLPDAGRTLLGMLLGLTCYGLSIGLFILAMRGLGSARTSTLFGTAPFMGVLLSILIFREPPNGLFWLSVPLMLVGASLMLSEDHQHNHMHDQVEHDHQHQHPDAHHQHPHPQNLRESGAHSHRHSHAILAHSHPHTPDIHHRHGHQTG